MRFEDLIAPMSTEEFLRHWYGKKPLHISAGNAQARGLIGWNKLNELLGLPSHWSEANIKLIFKGVPVTDHLYLDSVETLGGVVRRANLAKVDVFLQMGATLLAGAVHEISPEVLALAASLSELFAGRAEANLYCSFKGIQAFNSHFDVHEVFAVQCEGEKVWNIYENRVEAPIEAPRAANAKAVIDASKGRVAMQVRMRPGDMLYIPRGFCHDALASSGASLHVTLSVTPLDGRALFRLLEEEAILHSAFREYLPDARSSNERDLAEKLTSLGERMMQILTSRAFAAKLGNRQRQLVERNVAFDLPERRRLDFFARTERPIEFSREGPMTVLTSAGRSLPLESAAGAAEWILEQAGFSLQQLAATFPHLDEAELKRLVEALERMQIIVAYEPEI
ncbi:MAG TPA: cupin domain-containing protein [Allosphingosinicella sp.]|nr:cupin domain-containing protein [Allosphingosinicella sp.]